MSERRGPAWLGEFQARFGAMLRTPLDRRTGTLRAEVSSYDEALCDGALAGRWGSSRERLAVYNRQYWFRLFTVMQTACPLTAALAGFWEFNGLASQFLLSRAPSGWDIDHVPDGFASFLSSLPESAAPPPGAEALREAVWIDEAWREVFRAPFAAPYRPTLQEAGRLLAGRLRPSPAVAVVAESWPLLALRRSWQARRGEGAVVLPEPLEARRWWALVRRPDGLAQIPLEPREAELLSLLRGHPVGEALGLLERGCPPAELPALPELTRRWLARSVEMGAWSGLDDSLDTP